MTRVAAAVGALGLLLTACGDDGGAAPTTTAVEITLGQGLPVGASYEDPSGNVTLTVNGIRLTGGLLLADAEACAAEDSLPGLPIQPAAWQLRLRGSEQVVPSVQLADPNRSARPAWPATVALDPGTCVEGKVAFRLPPDARPQAVLFTQLAQPVAWRVRG